MKRPRGICPVCGRSIAGRLVDGSVVLRSHMKVLGGTKAAGWGSSVPCSGAGQPVEPETPSDPEAERLAPEDRKD